MTKIQSVLFPKDRFTLREAIVWLEGYGFSIPSKVDITPNYLRFRQFKPNRNHRMRTIDIGENGIKFIIDYTI